MKRAIKDIHSILELSLSLKFHKHCMVCKFQDLSITQILREINFVDYRSAKSAILTYLEALNFDFYVFLHFLKAEI